MKAAAAEIVAGRPVVLDLTGPVSRHAARAPMIVEGYPCPRCGQLRVRRCRVRSRGGMILALLLVARYRCHGCFHVFWAPAPMMWLVDS